MAVTLTNFVAAGFEGPVPDPLHIGGDGLIADRMASGARQIDCSGAYLSPGWTDLHVHVWHGGTDISVRASEAGRPTGVTAMADAGSAGEANFHGLREYVIDAGSETVRAFLNIGSIGLVACNRVPELIDMRSIDIDRTLEVIEANRDVICGVKVRASAVIVGAWGITPAKIAKRVAEIAELPLMVHVGEPPPLIDEVFDILTSGDILTHCFNGKAAGSICDTGEIYAKARALSEAGILFDIGHGVASFDFETARRALEDGLEPHSISTDLHLRNVDGPVHDLATTASKMLALGMPFAAVLDAIASRPRRLLRLEPAPNRPGERADFTVFDVVDTAVATVDSHGNELTLHQVLEPRWTVVGSSVEPAARRARPSGESP